MFKEEIRISLPFQSPPCTGTCSYHLYVHSQGRVHSYCMQTICHFGPPSLRVLQPEICYIMYKVMERRTHIHITSLLQGTIHCMIYPQLPADDNQLLECNFLSHKLLPEIQKSLHRKINPLYDSYVLDTSYAFYRIRCTFSFPLPCHKFFNLWTKKVSSDYCKPVLSSCSI